MPSKIRAEVKVAALVPREVAEALEREAADLGLGLSSYLRMLLLQHLRARARQTSGLDEAQLNHARIEGKG